MDPRCTELLRWSKKGLEEDGSGYKEKKVMKVNEGSSIRKKWIENGKLLNFIGTVSINEYYHNPCKDA